MLAEVFSRIKQLSGSPAVKRLVSEDVDRFPPCFPPIHASPINQSLVHHEPNPKPIKANGKRLTRNSAGFVSSPVLPKINPIDSTPFSLEDILSIN